MTTQLELARTDKLQYRVLKKLFPHDPTHMSGDTYAGKSKVKVLLGDAVLEQLKGKVVVDFGCGEGDDAIAIAANGARRVIGIDIREPILEKARAKAAAAGLEGVCTFTQKFEEDADAIVSIDSFEHFADPIEILKIMHSLLKYGGAVYASFGPTWFHPLGGHLFSVFPWSHLLFSEKALIRWRSDLRADGATRFREVSGGLNQMTVSRFERMVQESPLVMEKIETVPIRKLRFAHNSMTREFTTAIVRCTLRKPDRVGTSGSFAIRGE